MGSELKRYIDADALLKCLAEITHVDREETYEYHHHSGERRPSGFFMETKRIDPTELKRVINKLRQADTTLERVKEFVFWLLAQSVIHPKSVAMIVERIYRQFPELEAELLERAEQGDRMMAEKQPKTSANSLASIEAGAWWSSFRFPVGR